ncbi:MFS transporter [bacterium]|nr:MFS transporter [bacterium]
MKNLTILKKKNWAEVLSWSMYDFANSAFATTILAVIFNAYFAGVVAGGEEGVCINLLLFKIHLPGASLYSFSLSFSMLIVAVSGPVLGAIADFSASKKKFLFFYFVLGSIFTALLYFVGEGEYIFGTFIFVVSVVGFESANIFYNAFLPEIAEREDFGKVSGLGWAIGYIGGGLCLLLNLIMLRYPQILGFPEGYFSVNSCFVVVAVWWAVFSIPLFLKVKERAERKQLTKGDSYVSVGMRRIKITFKKIRNYRELIKFFISYFIYNNGIQTVIIMASIFGAQVLGMDDTERILYFLVIQGTAFIGSLLFGYLADRLDNRITIISTLCVWCVVVIWAYVLGIFFEPLTEFWIIGILAGLVMGGSQAASRSLQASFTPRKNTAEFFGFYAVVGRFASIAGPLVYGLTTWITGSLKSGIFSLIVFFIAGISILVFVDEKKGIQEAEQTITNDV